MPQDHPEFVQPVKSGLSPASASFSQQDVGERANTLIERGINHLVARIAREEVIDVGAANQHSSYPCFFNLVDGFSIAEQQVTTWPEPCGNALFRIAER